MGSTIITDKRAAAIIAADGTPFFALFAQTYESNVYPQTPRWSCFTFGTAEHCMTRIIEDAASTEGGGLRARNGRITPTSYIASWRKCLANPVELTVDTVCGKIGNGFSNIDPESQTIVKTVLGRHGIALGADGSITISLVEKPQALEQLLTELKLGAWRFIDGARFGSTVFEAAAYAPKLCQGDEIHIPIVFLQQAEGAERDHWVLMPDGSTSCTGWEYSTVQRLIHQYVVPAETARPGCAEDVIRRIRQCVSQRIALSPDQPVSVYRDRAKHSWNADTYDRLAKKLQRCFGQLSTTVGEITKSDALWELRSLPDEMLVFPSLRARLSGQPKGQLDLLTA